VVLAESHLGAFRLFVCRANDFHVHLLVSRHLQVFHRFVLIDSDLYSIRVRPLLELISSLLRRIHTIPRVLYIAFLNPGIDQRLLLLASFLSSVRLQVLNFRLLSILADFDFSIVARSVLSLNT
jgi:hypothetical protein